MPTLFSSIHSVDAAIKNNKQQLSTTDVRIHGYLKRVNLAKMQHQLFHRREFLMLCSEKMIRSIDEVNTRINKRIEQLEEERNELIAEIRNGFDEITTKLPAGLEGLEEIQDIPDPQKSTYNPAKTISSVKQYMTTFFRHNTGLKGSKNHFMYASIFSAAGIYTAEITQSFIDNMRKLSLSTGNFTTVMKYPLSLKDVDRAIHKSKLSQYKFVILDTSLRVILTNANNRPKVEEFLIYDSESNLYAPISVTSRDNHSFCSQCLTPFDALTSACSQPACCLICLRPGNPKDIGCTKATPDAAPRICSKCSAFCQSAKCFAAHSKICPRPPQSKMHDQVMDIIEFLNVCVFCRGKIHSCPTNPECICWPMDFMFMSKLPKISSE